MRENIDWSVANGGPGSSCLIAKIASKANAYIDEDVDGFMKLGDIKGELQPPGFRSENSFVIEGFEPGAGMDSFGESLDPSLQLGTNWCPGGAPAMTGKIGDDSGQMISPLGGGDGCAF